MAETELGGVVVHKEEGEEGLAPLSLAETQSLEWRHLSLTLVRKEREARLEILKDVSGGAYPGQVRDRIERRSGAELLADSLVAVVEHHGLHGLGQEQPVRPRCEALSSFASDSFHSA